MHSSASREGQSALRSHSPACPSDVLAEIEELGRIIAIAKADIAALRVDDINTSHIPSATDELDAIIAHTAAATDTILEMCEALDGVAEEIGEASARKLHQATTRIYEACGFQDITGQRITKVVATLKTIEAKLASIVGAFAVHPSATGSGPLTQAMLLNGPQLPATAMGQTDIDKLLASFE